MIAFDSRWWFEAWGHVRDGEWRRGELRIGITDIVIAQKENKTALLIPLCLSVCVSGSMLNVLQLHNILWPLKPACMIHLSCDLSIEIVFPWPKECQSKHLSVQLFWRDLFLFISKFWQISVLCLFRKIWFEFCYQKLESYLITALLWSLLPWKIPEVRVWMGACTFIVLLRSSRSLWF